MAQPTVWQRVKTGGKAGFDKTWKAVDKLGTPVNNLSNKLGSEAFWPTTLDKESDKAARILKSFCKDGFYAEEDHYVQSGPKQKQKVFKKIPSSVIRNAKGLAIFTTMRSGLWFSGAGGSGILIARKEDGTWSPPSGILLHTAGLGFLIGIDIYDCVVVINTYEALEAFTKIRCTLGSEISVAAGPVGAGGVLDTELHKRHAPIFTYLKSRGFYAGVQIDGTIIIERTDENERFYGHKIPVKDILSGKVRHPPFEVRRLLETIKAAQGDVDVDESILPTEAPPGDFEIDDGHLFGVPDKEDPDPYGVLALEKEGMTIKEAGTQKRASWETFNFNPSPSSPVHDMVAARNSNSHETGRLSRRSSWRTSALSNDARTPSSLRNSLDRPRSGVVMADTSTQTEGPDGPPSPNRRSWYSRRGSKGSLAHSSSMQDLPENEVLQTANPTNATQSRNEPESVSKANGYTTPPRTPPLHEEDEHDDDEDDHAHDDDVHISEPAVVQSVQSVQTVQSVAPQVISKPRIVNVPKRMPPKLPPRNPNRTGNSPLIVDASSKDAATGTSEPSLSPTFAPTAEETSLPTTVDKVSATNRNMETERSPSPAESKHDSGNEPFPEKEGDVESAAEKFDEIKLEDHDEAKSSQAANETEAERSHETDQVTMPGGW